MKKMVSQNSCYSLQKNLNTSDYYINNKHLSLYRGFSVNYLLKVDKI